MDFEYKTCQKCNKLFKYTYGQELCETCIAEGVEVDEEFIKVRDYLYENPRSSAMDISLKLKVNPKIIFRLVRDGRLSVLDNCKICGEPIGHGEICQKCNKLKQL